MKPEIENLKVWMSGRSTTGYQRALAMREFEQLLSYVNELEQLRQPPVISAVCPFCNGSGKVGTLDEYRDCVKCNGVGQTDL